MRCGLVGRSLKHSLSGSIHEIFYREIGMDGQYSYHEVEERDLGATLKGLGKDGYGGLNVTIPYKRQAMEHLDRVSREARSIGSINTIRYDGNSMEGHNTDYEGFGRLLERNRVQVTRMDCVVLGTGGASRAVVRYLLDKGAKSVTLVSRSPDAKDGFAGCRVISYRDLENFGHMDLVVNTTPVGMFPHMDSSPVGPGVVEKADCVVDLIYNPQETMLLSHARKLGKSHANGMYMLVAQAIAAQEIWNGETYGEEVVDSVYGKLLEQIQGEQG